MAREFNILVLDDDPSVREVFCRILQQFGRVLQAADSDEMYDLIRKGEKIDLFVLDKNVKPDRRYAGESAGLDVLAAIRRLYSVDAPAILATGYWMSKDELELAERLNAHLLQKPFKDIAQLEELVSRLLPKPSQTEDLSMITRYANVYFAKETKEPLIVGETYALYVRVSPIELKDIRARGDIDLPAAVRVNLLAVVHADDMDVSPIQGTLTVKENGYSDPIEFRLTPRSSSNSQETRQIQVCFYHGASFLRTIGLDVRVASSADECPTPLSPSCIDDPGDELHIYLAEHPVFNLTFLESSSGIVGTLGTADGWLYPDAIQSFNREEWEELNRYLRGALSHIAVEGCEMVNWQGEGLSEGQLLDFLMPLLDAGELAFNKLFPDPKTREDLCAIVDEAISLFNRVPRIDIAASSFLLPWDAVLFCVSESHGEHRLDTVDDLWGMKLVIHKKCSRRGVTVRPRSPIIDNIDRLEIGIAWNTEFDTVREFEIEHLSRFLDQVCVQVVGNPQKVEEVLELLEQELHILQFACHARIQSPIFTSCFEFSESAILTLAHLQNPRCCLAGAPLVVLSSCDSLSFDARLGFSFLQAFVEKGARGILGTEVPVNAPFASRFLTKVYQRFLEGKPVGQCVLEARKSCWENPQCRSPFGLIFSFYGDIATRLAKPLGDSTKEFECHGMECCQ